MTTTCRSVGMAIFVAAAMVPLGRAHAEDTPVDCRDGGRTQLEMNTCAGQKAEVANKRLAALLAELDRVLVPAARRGLASVQARWVELRDLDCKWEQSEFEGGSVAPTVYANCVASQTEQRIQRLSIFLCEGGGMTGPCEASRKYSSPEGPRSRTRG